MPSQAVHWEEGMFLSPQHFQAADRHARRALREAEDWFNPFNWGFRTLVVDEGAVSREGKVELLSGEARLKDGTHLTIGAGHDVSALSLDLAHVLETEAEVDVFLAVPVFQPGEKNVEFVRTPQGPRYYVEEPEEWKDENSGQSPQPVKFRRLQARLLHSRDNLTGYETLRVLRVTRKGKGGTPEVHNATVPCLLALEAWSPLRKLVYSVVQQVRNKLDQLAEQAVDREVSFRGQDPDDAERLVKLFALNEVEPPLRTLATTDGLRPFDVYVELCRAAGRLGVFLRERRVPVLPKYNHDNIGVCFKEVIKIILRALEEVESIPFEEAPLVRSGNHLRVALKEEWIDPRRMFVAVETKLSAEECDALLKDEAIDRTIASAARVETLFGVNRARGLSLTPLRRLDGLPKRRDYVYFSIAQTDPARWQEVENDRSLAIRFDTDATPFNAEDPNRVDVVSPSGRDATLRFIVFVVPPK